MRELLNRYHFFHLAGLLLVLFFFYYPVLFLGKTLQAPEMARMNQTFKSPPTVESTLSGKVPPQIFNIELSSAGYGFYPMDILLGKIYASKELPLWIPYQGLGLPFAAIYETGVFFPLCIIKSLLPTSTYDWFLIGEIWLAGIFTYVFFNLTGTNRISAFFGATLYMGSGAFSWYLQIPGFLNVAMLLPLLMIATHALFKKLSPVRVATMALVSGLVLYAGEPEAEFYAFILSGCYFLFKVFFNDKVQYSRLKHLIAYVIAIILALLIASPQIMLFLQLLKHSYNYHTGSGVKERITTNLQRTESFLLKGIFFPKLLDYGNLPLYHPSSDAWDLIGGYVGFIPLFFITLFSFIKEAVFKKIALFFTAFAAVILLLNFGIWPFSLIGYLPLFNISLSQKWAGPVWVFALTSSATYGFHVIQSFSLSDDKKKIIKHTVFRTSLILLLILLNARETYSSLPYIILNLYQPNFQLLINVIFASLSLGLITYLLLNYYNDMKCWVSCVLVLVVELQYFIPNGSYTFLFLNMYPEKYNYFMTQTIYLFISLSFLFLIFTYCRTQKKRTILIAFLLLFSLIVLSLKSSPGYPEYQAVEKPTPFIQYLQKQTNYNRIFGLDGILYRYYPSAFGLYDVRITPTLALKIYQNFLKQHINVPPDDGFFFETFPPIPPLTSNDLNPGVKFKPGLRRALNLFGVKFLIAPNKEDANWAYHFYPTLMQKTKLTYRDQFVSIYQNLEALPRVFLVSQYKKASSYQEAQSMLMQENFDMRNVAILEESIKNTENSELLQSTAKIIKFSNNKVTIEATTNQAGLLVLTDIYYPGWKVYVNGKQSSVERVDGLFRGVFLPSGKSIVVFSYEPDIFKIGLLLMLLGLLICFILIFKKTTRET